MEPTCKTCNKPVYKFNKIKYYSLYFHPKCLQCSSCKLPLTLSTISGDKGTPLCGPCLRKTQIRSASRIKIKQQIPVKNPVQNIQEWSNIHPNSQSFLCKMPTEILLNIFQILAKSGHFDTVLEIGLSCKLLYSLSWDPSIPRMLSIPRGKRLPEILPSKGTATKIHHISFPEKLEKDPSFDEYIAPLLEDITKLSFHIQPRRLSNYLMPLFSKIIQLASTLKLNPFSRITHLDISTKSEVRIRTDKSFFYHVSTQMPELILLNLYGSSGWKTHLPYCTPERIHMLSPSSISSLNLVQIFPKLVHLNLGVTNASSSRFEILKLLKCDFMKQLKWLSLKHVFVTCPLNWNILGLEDYEPALDENFDPYVDPLPNTTVYRFPLLEYLYWTNDSGTAPMHIPFIINIFPKIKELVLTNPIINEEKKLLFHNTNISWISFEKPNSVVVLDLQVLKSLQRNNLYDCGYCIRLSDYIREFSHIETFRSHVSILRLKHSFNYYQSYLPWENQLQDFNSLVTILKSSPNLKHVSFANVSNESMFLIFSALCYLGFHLHWNKFRKFTTFNLNPIQQEIGNASAKIISHICGTFTTEELPIEFRKICIALNTGNFLRYSWQFFASPEDKDMKNKICRHICVICLVLRLSLESVKFSRSREIHTYLWRHGVPCMLSLDSSYLLSSINTTISNFPDHPQNLKTYDTLDYDFFLWPVLQDINNPLFGPHQTYILKILNTLPRDAQCTRPLVVHPKILPSDPIKEKYKVTVQMDHLNNQTFSTDPLASTSTTSTTSTQLTVPISTTVAETLDSESSSDSENSSDSDSDSIDLHLLDS